jgi:hypothetical protein
MRRYAPTIAGTALTAAVVAIIAARGPDAHESPPGATVAAASSTGAEAAHLSTPAAIPAPLPLAAIAPSEPQRAAANSAPLATERDVTRVEEPRPAASALAQVVGQAQQENDELRQIERDLAEGLQEAADDAWRREAVAAQAAARRAATLEALATLRRSDALLATGDSDGVDDELARAAEALSGRTLLDVEAAREALARDDLYPAREYLEAALAERRVPR